MVEAGKMTHAGFNRVLFDISDVFTEIERTLKAVSYTHLTLPTKA